MNEQDDYNNIIFFWRRLNIHVIEMDGKIVGYKVSILIGEIHLGNRKHTLCRTTTIVCLQ